MNNTHLLSHVHGIMPITFSRLPAGWCLLFCICGNSFYSLIRFLVSGDLRS